MTSFFKRLLGRLPKNEAIVERKTIEAHQIKRAMTEDSLRSQKKVDRINVNTYRKLSEVSANLQSVTYNIAIATGGKKRGLK